MRLCFGDPTPRPRAPARRGGRRDRRPQPPALGATRRSTAPRRRCCAAGGGASRCGRWRRGCGCRRSWSGATATGSSRPAWPPAPTRALGGRLLMLPGVGHVAQIEAPEAVAAGGRRPVGRRRLGRGEPLGRWRLTGALPQQRTRAHQQGAENMALPPLVEPAAELTIDEVARYSRHLIIPDVGHGRAEAAEERQGAGASARAGSARRRCCTWPPPASARSASSSSTSSTSRTCSARSSTASPTSAGPRPSRARDSIREINPLRRRCGCTRCGSTRDNVLDIFARVRPDPRRHRQLRHPLPGQRRRACCWASPTCGARSTASRARSSVFWAEPDGRA